MRTPSFKGGGRRRDSLASTWVAVQRLFSTFPNGWPGAGLLLVRLCLATALIDVGGGAVLSPAVDAITLVENALAIVAGALVLAGLWTPLAGILAVLEETAQALSLYSLAREAALVHAFLAVLSASVAMLGPGAWSIDARLFGRKRFDLDRTRGRRP
jgi:putative oxidoreductase